MANRQEPFEPVLRYVKQNASPITVSGDVGREANQWLC
jgi:hypothetical protein